MNYQQLITFEIWDPFEDDKIKLPSFNTFSDKWKLLRIQYLCLWLVRSQWGGPEFDHICEFGDCFDSLLGGAGQGLLIGGGSLYQSLSFLHQSFGSLQNVLSTNI